MLLSLGSSRPGARRRRNNEICPVKCFVDQKNQLGLMREVAGSTIVETRPVKHCDVRFDFCLINFLYQYHRAGKRDRCFYNIHDWWHLMTDYAVWILWSMILKPKHWLLLLTGGNVCRKACSKMPWYLKEPGMSSGRSLCTRSLASLSSLANSA